MAAPAKLPIGTRTVDRGAVELPGHTLAKLLNDAGYLAIDLAVGDGADTGQLRLAVELPDGSVLVTVPAGTISVDDLRVLEEQPGKTRSRYARHRNLKNPPVVELEELGLPLYWNEDWLREKYDECGAFAEVGRRYRREVRGVHHTTIANYARTTFEWSVRDDIAKKRDALLTEFADRGGDVAQRELAAKYGVPASSVNRWISSAQDAHQVTQRDRTTLAGDEKAQEALAAEHGVPIELVRRWLKRASSVFATRRAPQKKQHYHSRAQYEDLREQARTVYKESRGRVTKTKLARELGVDRSTISEWFKEFGDVD